MTGQQSQLIANIKRRLAELKLETEGHGRGVENEARALLELKQLVDELEASL